MSPGSHRRFASRCRGGSVGPVRGDRRALCQYRWPRFGAGAVALGLGGLLLVEEVDRLAGASNSIMPNWLFAALMTVRSAPGVAAADVALGVGVLVTGFDGVALVAGDVGSDALGAPAPLGTSFARPTSTAAHTTSAR
jgi:hypothetical protein